MAAGEFRCWRRPAAPTVSGPRERPVGGLAEAVERRGEGLGGGGRRLPGRLGLDGTGLDRRRLGWGALLPRGLSGTLGFQSRRERYPRSPGRGLDPHRAAYALALPGYGGLRLKPRDPDLSEFAQVAGEGARVAALGPQLGWGLDQGPACLVLCHASGFAWPRLT